MPKGVYTRTLEANKKNSIGHKGHIVLEETRKKISESLKGHWGWNTGLTKETDKRVAKAGENISKVSKGIPKSKEDNKKNSIGNKIAWEKRAESSIYPRNYLCPNFNFNSIYIFKALDKALHTRSRYGGTKEGEKKIGRYFVDYFNNRNKLIIEWNESSHYNSNGKLKIRDIKKRKYILGYYPEFKYFIIKQSDWINIEKDLIINHILQK